MAHKANFESPPPSPKIDKTEKAHVTFPDEKVGPQKNLYRDIHKAAQDTETFYWLRSQWGNIPPPVAGHSLNKFSVQHENDPLEQALLVLFAGNADLSQPRTPQILKSSNNNANSAEGFATHNTLINSLFVLNSSSMEWAEVIAQGKAPTPRYAHAAVSWDNHRMIVFGGRGASHDTNDTFCLVANEDWTQWTWKQVQFSDDVKPPPCHGHTLTMIDNYKCVLFGGHTKSDIWILRYDPETNQGQWVKVQHSGTPPDPRYYHGAASVTSGSHSYLVIFGGKSTKGQALNDLSVLDFEISSETDLPVKSNWVTPPPIQCGVRPTARYNHTMSIIGKKIFIFGGVGNNGLLNDVHVFEILKQSWSSPFTVNPPASRARHAASFVGERIIVFGGVSQPTEDNDTWLSDLVILDTKLAEKTGPKERAAPARLFGISSVTMVDTEHGTVHQTHLQDLAHSTNTLRSLTQNRRDFSMSYVWTGLAPDKMPVGLRVLQLLQRNFVPVVPYTWKKEEPSHRWTDKEALAEFLNKLPQLFEKAATLMSTEKSLVEVSSPAYVLGDVHGNYKDLIHFENMLWKTGVKLCPANIVFLGDYVDRGPHSLETVAYIFALKVSNPKKVILLRGNHETRHVNGDIGLYKEGSFKHKCRELVKECEGNNNNFQVLTGDELWEKINNSFDFLPLASIIDSQIFCMHGGVPRYLHDDLLIKLANFERPLTQRRLEEDCHSHSGSVAFDLLWSDPATEEEDNEMDRRKLDFAANDNRGGSTAIFGSRALGKFLEITGCTHIIRAHQPPNLGVDIEKAGRVLTVFSSSHFCTIYDDDEEQGVDKYNLAACVLVAEQRLRIIVLKPKPEGDTTTTNDEKDNFHIEVDN